MSDAAVRAGSRTMARYDAIIIGTGRSGPALAHRFAKEGKRVAIIERKRFGGTCVNNGCWVAEPADAIALPSRPRVCVAL